MCCIVLQAHHEFGRYASLGGHADHYTRAAAAKAFDHLVSQGLVAYVDTRWASIDCVLLKHSMPAFGNGPRM
jgi:hypothetical protein